MVSVIVAGLTGLIFVQLSSILDSIRPAPAADLAWITKRGAVARSTTAPVRLFLTDEGVIRKVARDYVAAGDVVHVLVVGEDGTLLLRHNGSPERAMNVLVLAPNTAHTHGDRMQSGMFGGAAAMSLCAAFVAQYVAPVLRPTQSTFKQLEHTTQAALEAAVLGLSKSMLDMPLSAKLRRCVERIVPAQRVQEVVELAGDRAERRCVVVARTAHALQRKRERVLEAGITFAPCPPEQRARPHTGRQCPWRS